MEERRSAPPVGGQKAESAIENGAGRVRVGDGVWNARGPDAPAGASVVIVAADGTCLTVELAP
jgi:membrane protein implicated in regulation of membrane protease activity